MAEPAPHCVAENGIERRPYRQRQPQVVGGEAEPERGDREHRPRMHPPVEDGRRDRKPARGLGVRGIDPERRVQEVFDRFCHPEEHEADPDSGREQHREPRPDGVVWPRVRSTKAYATNRGCQEEDAEEEECIGCSHEHPIEGRDEPTVQPVEDAGGRVAKTQHAGDECDDGKAGYEEDRVVDLDAQELDVVATDLVVSLRSDDSHAER